MSGLMTHLTSDGMLEEAFTWLCRARRDWCSRPLTLVLGSRLHHAE